MSVTSKGGRHRLRTAVVVTVVVLLTLAPAGAALAVAASPASCMGHEASDISPPGSSTEFPEGMPGLKPEINELFPGVAFGRIINQIAGLREGSHEACDAALE
jgi:hypothetical protein